MIMIWWWRWWRRRWWWWWCFPHSGQHLCLAMIMIKIMLMMMMLIMIMRMMMMMMMMAKGSLWNICSLLFGTFLFLPPAPAPATGHLFTNSIHGHLALKSYTCSIWGFKQGNNVNLKFNIYDIINTIVSCFCENKSPQFKQWWRWCKWFPRFKWFHANKEGEIEAPGSVLHRPALHCLHFCTFAQLWIATSGAAHLSFELLTQLHRTLHFCTEKLHKYFFSCYTAKTFALQFCAGKLHTCIF